MPAPLADWEVKQCLMASNFLVLGLSLIASESAILEFEYCADISRGPISFQRMSSLERRGWGKPVQYEVIAERYHWYDVLPDK